MNTSTVALYNDKIEQALYYAERSTIKTFSTGAVIWNQSSGRIAAGWSHDSMFRLTRFKSIHAEVHAVLRTPRKEMLEGASIAIAMIRNKSGNVGLSKPCDGCMAILFEVGIKHAIFTDGEGGIDEVWLQ